MTLNGKKILLGLSGGVAAYKAAELTRLLIKAGADVRVAMTEAATRFIGTATMQALSGQPVWTDLWDARVPDSMGHIELSRDRDLIVVAPATADFMARVVHGRADDLLAALCVARRCPLMLAPAMNVEMWENPATQRNVAALQSDGVHLAGQLPGTRPVAKPAWAGCSSRGRSWARSKRCSGQGACKASECWSPPARPKSRSTLCGS